MSTSLFVIGEVARITLLLTNTTGAVVDPGALRLKVRHPVTAVVTTYAYGGGVVIKDSIGNYHADVALPAAGQWAWRWESDAPNAGATEGSLSVSPSIF